MSDTFNTTPSNWQGVDSEPTAGSDNLVKSGGAIGLAEINVNFSTGKFIDYTGIIKTTSTDYYKLTDELYAVPGIKLFRARAAGTNGCVVVFYDNNHNFVSYLGIGSTGLTDMTLSDENIPATAVYFRANMDTTRGRVFSKYRTNIKPYIEELSNRANKENNSVFYLQGFTSYKNGRQVLSGKMYYCTPYIEVDDVTDGTQICCFLNSNIGIQCFDSEKQFIGTYNDFNNIDVATDITFSFDSSKLVQNTKYIRLCCRYNRGYIKGLSYNGKYAEQTDNGYAVVIGDISETVNRENISHILRNIKQLKIDANYYDYDAVYIVRIPNYAELKNPDSSDYFILDFYEDGSSEKIRSYLKIKNGTISGDNIFFNTGNIVLEYDYSQLHNSTVYTGENLAKLTIKAFAYAFPQPVTSEKYVESIEWPDIASSFTHVEYKTDKVLDVTCQRFPATADALAENSEEFFIFYVWNGESMVKKIYCYIKDGNVDGTVITYNSDLLSFVVDYTIAGTVSRKSSITRQDLTLTPAAFVITKQEDTHIRKDIVNKKYANMSSSTFSSAIGPSPFASKKWHKELIEDLGMEYSDYGMGGTRYRCYASTKFSLDYQNSDQTLYPTANRVMLNQVAKICTDAANDGYYPDIITSCCVLNDCYNTTDLINKIGTAEEAFAQTLPEFDLSTAATIERDFTAFYESTDPDIIDFKSKSCNCMRLVYDLLSRRFPKAQIIIWSCQQVTYSGMNQDAITHFNEEQKKIAKKFAIQYVDLNAECGVNQITASTFLNSDGLHPNASGQTVYYNYVKEKLNSVIALKKELSK